MCHSYIPLSSDFAEEMFHFPFKDLAKFSLKKVFSVLIWFYKTSFRKQHETFPLSC